MTEFVTVQVPAELVTDVYGFIADRTRPTTSTSRYRRSDLLSYSRKQLEALAKEHRVWKNAMRKDEMIDALVRIG